MVIPRLFRSSVTEGAITTPISRRPISMSFADSWLVIGWSAGEVGRHIILPGWVLSIDM